MGRVANFDMDVLRTFVTGVSLGSFARAADRLGRSPSAISLQLRKLEEQAGKPLLVKRGRGLALTEAGELMFSYARRILDLNDEAALALAGEGGIAGWLRVGMPEDFAEHLLPALLGRFARAHPKVKLEARADRGVQLVQAVERGGLDLALAWGELDSAHCRPVAERSLVWVGTPGFSRREGDPVRLVAFDAPCAFRSAAIAALDGAGISWRHVFASPSLAGLWAAVTAGLGVTVRVADGVPAHLARLDPDRCGLPPLPPLGLRLHLNEARPPPAVALFRDLLLDAIETENAGESGR
ncbi:LysR substrate-binding domain-containing protein [Rhizobiaceae bacterium BDR2-2]|uniref:LysR substrate-binding domain-containing protein n=1 Tax=Ectorhizobium quercum TaxID=2965071 RepID=A0AAE3MY66_9HYPH|nr:LysR substrate-binding domain-containing protein [Ectorhizobium quercum]MCX8996451.1 LysR substrate-binding domain-containing protein [Ectorhizobium quercum]